MNKPNQIFAGFAGILDGRNEFPKEVSVGGEASVAGLFFHLQDIIENALQRSIVILVTAFDLKFKAKKKFSLQILFEVIQIFFFHEGRFPMAQISQKVRLN